jgi:type I restriction enzyme, S subunit
MKPGKGYKPQNTQNRQKKNSVLDSSASSAYSAVLQHFDQISEAPEAIPRLRRFILDLAVRGKLAEQDPNDELAAELLKQIEAEKQRLEETGQIKNGKHYESIKGDEIPFSVPQSWIWARLGNITTYLQRGKSPQYATGFGPPVISQKCIQWDGLHMEWAKSLVPESLENYEPVRFLQDGDLLWNSTGTGTIGRLIRVDRPPELLVCDSHVTIIRCLLVYERFIFIWLRSDYVYGTIEGRAIGATKQVELTASMANNQITPLPPLAEQHRIVAKVEELMKLCDELAAAQQKREKRRDRLVTASLTKLTDETENKQILKFSVSSACSAVSRPEHIHQLRQTILNLAVRGKLVQQNPKDEPATELLKRIKKEKFHPAINGMKGREAELTPINEKNAPFKLPAGWAWSRFPELGTFGRGKSKHRPRNDPSLFEGGTHLLVQTGDVARSNGHIETFTGKYNETGLAQSAKWPKGTLCITIAANIADSGILSFDACFPDSVVGFIPAPVFPDARYFEYFIRTAKAQLMEFAPATAQKNINLGILNEVLIPLPPLAEQQRIVEKVNELMALCYGLEARLTTTTKTRNQLLESTLIETLKVDIEKGLTVSG